MSIYIHRFVINFSSSNFPPFYLSTFPPFQVSTISPATFPPFHLLPFHLSNFPPFYLLTFQPSTFSPFHRFTFHFASVTYLLTICSTEYLKIDLRLIAVTSEYHQERDLLDSVLMARWRGAEGYWICLCA